MYNLYQCNKNDTARFILGKDGDNKLFIIGLNPSTANHEKSDTTVAKVEKVAINNGYKGFVMANLYPFRATDPNNLPQTENKYLIRENLKAIQKLAETEEKPIFWAAWGNDITKKPYLINALKQIVEVVKKANGTWVNYGELTKQKHPRHPSRLSYSWSFSEFNIDNYLENIT